MDKTVALYWLKKDIRLNDNAAFMTALRQHSTVIPIFVLEESYLSAPETSIVHVNALFEALRDFKEKLADEGVRPLYVYGETVHIFQKLFERHKFGYIYSHEEIGNDLTYKRDRKVAKFCLENRITWREMQQTGVVRRLKNRDDWAIFWKDFYGQRVESIPSSAQLKKIKILPAWENLTMRFEPLIESVFDDKAVKELSKHSLQHVSETNALADLHDFMYNRGVKYRGGISSPNTALAAGSRLSVHLAFGTISGRYVYRKVNERIYQLSASNEPNARKWIGSLISFKSRLHWRDHFIQRLESEPRMEFRPLNSAYEKLQYINDQEQIEAFFAGKTGYPLIDAVMRCLYHTRFINFRMRAMVTSFACHTLQIDWRIVNVPLAKLFLDYEPGIHLSQLQMQAGVVGINTLRTYNPTKQLIEQDPNCVFVKKWIPELQKYTPAEIIDHINFPLPGYHPPIVEWKTASAEMRKKITEIRKSNLAKATSQTVFQKHGSRRRNTMGTRKTKPRTDKSGTLSLFE